MEINMEPLQRQMLDDVFDAFTMLTNGSFVSLMHVDGGFTRYTASAVELFGLPGEYVPNGAMDWNDYLHPDDRKRYMEVMMPLLEGKTQTYDITYRVRTVKGDYQVMRAVGAVLRGSNGKPSLIGGVTFNEGLTDRVDPITVLPSKKVYQEDLTRAIREEKEIFSLQVGISQFSEINRVHGYTYGNRIIQEIAWMIQESVEKRGKVYRMDGPSFVILTDKMTRESIAALYDHIRYKLQRGIEVNGVNHTLMASGGLISTFSSDANAQTICSCLKYAYYESEKHMHGELVDFNGSFRYENTKSLEIINTIRECINNDCLGFNLEYLPVVNVKTGNINGVEALVYWENKKYGKILSKDFLPILEHDFIFEELGDFILHQGFSDGKKFLEKVPNFYLCLNVYYLQLESDYFVENLLFYLNESNFPSELLSLKFDSSCRYIGIDRMKKIISRLHENKILVIIDDFGSGTDSIEFLKSEPIDAVSIAEKFTKDIVNDKKYRNTLRHLAEIASDYVDHINIKGVDNEKLHEIVTNFPITTFQGNYFSKPLSANQMLQYLDSD